MRCCCGSRRDRTKSRIDPTTRLLHDEVKARAQCTRSTRLWFFSLAFYSKGSRRQQLQDFLYQPRTTRRTKGQHHFLLFWLWAFSALLSYSLLLSLNNWLGLDVLDINYLLFDVVDQEWKKLERNVSYSIKAVGLSLGFHVDAITNLWMLQLDEERQNTTAKVWH